MQAPEFEQLWQSAHPNQGSPWDNFAQQRIFLAERCNQVLQANPPIREALREHAQAEGVDISGLSKEQIDAVIPLTWNPTDVFQQNFSQIFAHWYREWDENRYREFANARHDENHVVFS